jgi:hypothetical protein
MRNPKEPRFFAYPVSDASAKLVEFRIRLAKRRQKAWTILFIKVLSEFTNY